MKLILLLVSILPLGLSAQRTVTNFNKGWKFYYADTTDRKMEYKDKSYDDSKWRNINLPHDFSIELPFKKDAPAGFEGASLPGGIGWYRKTFTVPASSKNKYTYIEFDGVYRLAEVWINGHYLGIRPNGYISFRYDLTSYLNFGSTNIISVKADNSKQPNSRWYSGSGIYRDVRLVTTSQVAIDQWGTFVTTSGVSTASATVDITVNVMNNTPVREKLRIVTSIYYNGVLVSTDAKPLDGIPGISGVEQIFTISKPELWSVSSPKLYKAITQVIREKNIIDEYTTDFGIRYFNFDSEKGFSLNGERMKILGVCNHHDLGCLGAAFNIRAAERQLEILKEMGCNAIRTSHNPPAPQLLDLCDKMGFLVMDEAFDMWKVPKRKYDYSNYWDEWHKKDLEDQVLRDRNHPSVIMWSIGNEIPEQWSEKADGAAIARELSAIVKSLDTTRPVVDANDHPSPGNHIIGSGGVDIIGYNYHHKDWLSFPTDYPGKLFIATETTSGLQTRGYYQMPSDSIYAWPWKVKVTTKDVAGPMNPDYTVSAYDQVRAPWSSTHEQSWKPVKKYDYMSGMFIWTGFDYLGEPTPYEWPAKSSYFGIIDMAGFPKDVYYMYQSEWSNKDVLHIFPHWNWQVPPTGSRGDSVDVWAYYNHADEVELYLNGRSLGKRKKEGEDLHVMWRVKYQPGNIKAVSRKNGGIVLSKQINTAGLPSRIELVADRPTIRAGVDDLCFVTVRILDREGNLVPNTDDLIGFKLNGDATIAGVDNGDPVDHDPLNGSSRHAFHGLALVVIKAGDKKGNVVLTASGKGLAPVSLTISVN